MYSRIHKTQETQCQKNMIIRNIEIDFWIQISMKLKIEFFWSDKENFL